jgi:hypothetical protein
MTKPDTTTLLKKKTNSFTSPPAAQPPRNARPTSGLASSAGPAAGEAVLAADDDEAARREGQRVARVLLDHEDADAAGVDPSHLRKNLADVDWAEAGRRLVQEQQLRLAHEGAAHGNHLALAAGQLPGLLPPLDFEVGKHGVDRTERGLDVIAPDVGTHLQVLLHRHGGEDIELLGHEGETQRHQRVRLGVGDVAAGKADRTRARGDQSEDGLEDGGFARAIGTDDDADVGRCDVETDAVQDRCAAVAGVEPADLDQAHADSSSCSPRYASMISGFGADLGHGAFGDDAPGGHHDHRIAQLADEIHVVLDDEEGVAELAVHALDVLGQALEQRTIDASGDLVEEHRPGVDHHGAAELEKLLLPAREVAGALVRDRRQLEEVEDAQGLLPDVGLDTADFAGAEPRRKQALAWLTRRHHHQVVQHSEVGELMGDLEGAQEAAFEALVG